MNILYRKRSELLIIILFASLIARLPDLFSMNVATIMQFIDSLTPSKYSLITNYHNHACIPMHSTVNVGTDFQLAMPAPFVLSFDPTESRLPIPLDIIDDQILELNEQFQLQLSVGQSDPPTGHSLGRIQSALVQIIDNEGVYLCYRYYIQWI